MEVAAIDQLLRHTIVALMLALGPYYPTSQAEAAEEVRTHRG